MLIKLVMLKVYQKFQPEVVSWCAYLLLNIYLYAFGFLDVLSILSWYNVYFC